MRGKSAFRIEIMSDHHHHDDGHGSTLSGPALRVKALESLLVEKGLVDAKTLDEIVDTYENKVGPRNGARIVARAWVDPAFKQRLLADGRAACAEMGAMLEAERLIAVENTPEVHNVIVCTLCSCYPRALLGMPPTWYKSRNYRSRVVFEPRAVLKEFGTELPDSVTVRVHDSNADMRYLVVPMRPQGTEGWSEVKLAGLLSRDMLVGVTVPKV